MAFCECKEAALCETSETQGVTLEGSVHFDFLKAEDRRANESLEAQKSRWWFALQGSCPRGWWPPFVSPASLSAAPQTLWLQSVTLAPQSICFQILKPKSVAEKDMQVSNGLEREGCFLLMFVCTRDMSSQLYKQTGAINWKFPEFPATGGENWHGKRKSKVYSHCQAHGSWRKNRFGLLGQKCPLLSYVYRARAVLSLYLNAASK